MMLLSFDSKYLFNVNGTYISVYSVLSGEVVYKLNYNPGTNNTDDEKNSNAKTDLLINSICINPINKYQLLSFHQNGCVCLWDYEDGLYLKSFETKILIKKIISIEKHIYAVGQINQSKYDESLSLYKLNLTDMTLNDSNNKNMPIKHEIVLSNLMVNKDKFEIVIDKNERYVVYIESRKRLVVNQFKISNMLKKFKSKIELTCLALHPNEDCIATGTTNGKIILWYNYLSALMNPTDGMIEEEQSSRKQKTLKPTTTILHWHSLPVLCLQFTSEGSYLLSGGYECVLVKWFFKTGQKDFKPRLAAPVKEIFSAKDNSLYVTQHLDNTIHLIGTNLNIIQTFANFVCPNFLTRFNAKMCNKLKNLEWDEINEHTFYPSGLTLFQNLNCFVTNGKPGHLQFYSFSADKLLFNLDVANENFISPENLNRPNIHTEIESIAFNSSSNSDWLATVERRDDLVSTPECKLKFWYYNKTEKKFTLNTLIRFPHSFDKINHMKFKPKSNVLFTCGEDGCFKSWSINESSSNWVYNSCNGYRDLSPSYISFYSKNEFDLIFVSFKHILTIWSYSEFDGATLISDLIHCDSNDPIREFKIINTNSSSLRVIVIHDNCLNSWNVDLSNDNNLDRLQLNSKCIWSHKLNLNEMCQFLSLNEQDEEMLFKNGDQCLMLIIKREKSNDNRKDEAKTSIKLKLFNGINNNMKTIYTLNLNSMGKIHFATILKQKNDFVFDENSIKDLMDIFYCDDRGFVQKFYNDTSPLSGNHINSDLNESMWENRKILTKKMLLNDKTSILTNIIDFHKTSHLNKNNELIENDTNNLFHANLKKIESTPAYLMPKIGTFCYLTLESMLNKINDMNNNNNKIINEK